MKNYERQYLLLVFFVEQLHLLVEVGSKKAVLDDTVFLKLVFGVFFGDFGSDFTGIFQDFHIIGNQNPVKVLCPVCHSHRNLAFGTAFSLGELLRNS